MGCIEQEGPEITACCEPECSRLHLNLGPKRCEKENRPGPGPGVPGQGSVRTMESRPCPALLLFSASLPPTDALSLFFFPVSSLPFPSCSSTSLASPPLLPEPRPQAAPPVGSHLLLLLSLPSASPCPVPPALVGLEPHWAHTLLRPLPLSPELTDVNPLLSPSRLAGPQV